MKKYLLFFLLISCTNEHRQSQLEFYSKDIKPIFEKRCFPCHSGTNRLPNWGDYPTAKRYSEQIRYRVFVLRSMPIGPITEEERNKIRDWVDQGARE